MQSSVAYDLVQDEPNEEAERRSVQSPPRLTWDGHASTDQRTSSEQDQPAASMFTGSYLNGEQPQTVTDSTAIRAMSIDSLQCAFPDAPWSIGSIHPKDQRRETNQPILPRYSNEHTLDSDGQDFQEPHSRRLPSRTTIRRDFFWGLAWFFDIVLTILPLLFLAIAALAVHLDHQPRSDLGERALAASRLGPTLFPITFAAISSRFFENLSRWHLERPNGIRLGTLEQISGSQSFPGAVQRAFTVRSGHWASIVITMIWALSPLGGQSSLRLFIRGQDTFETELDVFVANPEYQESTFGSGSAMSDDSNAMSTIYSGLLLSAPPQRAAPIDLWNRPKVPQLSQVVVANHNMEWHNISDTDLQYAEDYTSLLGLDVRGITLDIPGRQIHFKVESSYLDMDCERVTNKGPKNVSFESSFEASLDIYSDRGWYYNTEPSGHRLSYDSRTDQGLNGGSAFNARFECLVRRIPVEVEFRCGPFPTTDCGARRLRQREERFDTPPSEFGPETLVPPGLFQTLPWSMGPVVVQNLAMFWPTAAGRPEQIYGASATDNFLAGDDALFVSQWVRDWDHDAANMTLFSRRMTTAFNTIFQVSLHPRNVTTADPLFTGKPGTYWAPDYDKIKATASNTRDAYIADRRWCASLLLVASILEVLAIAGLVLRAWITGPALLGYASSLTRDNPYFPESVSSCGSALGGSDRARMCRDMRVHIMDVRPFEEKGYIVFKSVSSQGDGELAWSKRALHGNRLFE